MASTSYQTLIELGGKLDPSLQAAMAKGQREMRQLAEYAKSAGVGMDNSFVRAARTAQTAFREITHSAESAAHRMQHSFSEATERIRHQLHGLLAPLERIGHLTGIGGLVGAGIGAFAGERFLHQGFEVRGEREVLQNQLRTILTSAHRGQQFEQVDDMLRQIADNQAPILYEELAKTSSRMLSAGGNRFNTPAKLHEMLMALANVSPDQEAFAGVSQAFTRILSQHQVDAAHLREISMWAGFDIRGQMAKTARMTPEKLTEALRKHQFTGDQQIQMLVQAMLGLSAPGGPAAGLAAQHMTGLKGIETRGTERFRDLMESFGKVEEQFLEPLSNKLFKALGPGELKHAFDTLLPSAQKLGEGMAKAFSTLQDTGRFAWMGATLRDIFWKIGGAVRDAFGIKGNLSIADTIVSGFDRVKDMLIWVDAHMDTIIATSKLVVEGLVAINAIKFTSGIVSAIGTISSALITTRKEAEATKGALGGLGLSPFGTVAAVGAGVWGLGEIAKTAAARQVEQDFFRRLGFNVNQANEALKGFPTRLHEFYDQFGPAGKAIGDFAAVVQAIIISVDSLLLGLAGKGISAGWDWLKSQSGRPDAAPPGNPLLDASKYSPFGDRAFRQRQQWKGGGAPSIQNQAPVPMPTQSATQSAAQMSASGAAILKSPGLENLTSQQREDILAVQKAAKESPWRSRDVPAPLPQTRDLGLPMSPLLPAPGQLPGHASRTSRAKNLLRTAANRMGGRGSGQGTGGGDLNYSVTIHVQPRDGEDTAAAVDRVMRAHSDEFYRQFKIVEHQRGRVSFYPSDEFESDDV